MTWHFRAVKSALLLLALTSLAHATPEVPRWRVRGALLSGVGGSSAGGELLTVFPMTLELGVRIHGGLSATVSGQGVLMGATYTACGEERRANAAFGTAGLRFDFANDKSASWIAPFLEVHAGAGGQAGGRTCDGNGVFGTGGAKLGFDVWLGRVAVTMALAIDYLPEAPPVSFALGATVIFK
jgi:hypothetical protein